MNLLKITERSIQSGKKTEKGISTANGSIKLAASELKLTDKETQILKHDIAEVRTSFAQLGLMVVGMFPGWGEPADAASAAIDFATGHPISGTISAFCACPIAGWIGDIPLSGIRVYRFASSSLKCGKTIFVIAKTGGRVEKVYVWFGKKVIEATQNSKVLKVIQKNFFDPISKNLYELFEKLESAIKHIKKATSSTDKIDNTQLARKEVGFYHNININNPGTMPSLKDAMLINARNSSKAKSGLNYSAQPSVNKMLYILSTKTGKYDPFKHF